MDENEKMTISVKEFKNLHTISFKYEMLIRALCNAATLSYDKKSLDFYNAPINAAFELVDPVRYEEEVRRVSEVEQ